MSKKDASNENELVLKLYDLIKGYQKHEDGLIVSRLGSLVLVSSFLFTGLAIASSSIDKLYQFRLVDLNVDSINIRLNMYFSILFMFGCAGYACAASCLKGIMAARAAIGELDNRWRAAACDFKHVDVTKHIPNIVDGGRSENSYQNTDSNSIGTARVLKYLWLILAISSLALIFIENVFRYEFNASAAKRFPSQIAVYVLKQ